MSAWLIISKERKRATLNYSAEVNTCSAQWVDNTMGISLFIVQKNGILGQYSIHFFTCTNPPSSSLSFSHTSQHRKRLSPNHRTHHSQTRTISPQQRISTQTPPQSQLPRLLCNSPSITTPLCRIFITGNTRTYRYGYYRYKWGYVESIAHMVIGCVCSGGKFSVSGYWEEISCEGLYSEYDFTWGWDLM